MNLLCREDANDAVLPPAIAAVAMATATKPFVLRLVGSCVSVFIDVSSFASPQFAVNTVVLQLFRFTSLTSEDDRSFLGVWLGGARQLLRRFATFA